MNHDDPVHLILADAPDPLATIVATRLRDMGRTVVLVSASELLASAVTYRATGGRAEWQCSVHGTSLDSSRIRSVLNRTRRLAPVGFGNSDDESYATSERAALLAAMVGSLDALVANRSNGATLAGPPAFPLHWLLTAARCGLPIRRTELATSGAHRDALREIRGFATVIGERVSGDVEPSWRPSLVALAEELDCHLLQVAVGTGTDGWCVDWVDTLPDVLDTDALQWLVDDLAGQPTPGSADRDVA